MLSFNEHDIPILVAAGLLRPLGNPPANGIKFFAEVEVRELAGDRCWLAKATNAIHRYWFDKNRRRTALLAPWPPSKASPRLKSRKHGHETAATSCGTAADLESDGSNRAKCRANS